MKYTYTIETETISENWQERLCKVLEEYNIEFIKDSNNVEFRNAFFIMNSIKLYYMLKKFKRCHLHVHEDGNIYKIVWDYEMFNAAKIFLIVVTVLSILFAFFSWSFALCIFIIMAFWSAIIHFLQYYSARSLLHNVTNEVIINDTDSIYVEVKRTSLDMDKYK